MSKGRLAAFFRMPEIIPTVGTILRLSALVKRAKSRQRSTEFFQLMEGIFDHARTCGTIVHAWQALRKHVLQSI
jgi:hypothetical protein